jgi:aminoglycoside 6'-N-acetyltransferase-1b/aminoglycoside 6'-N-acetyltransferase-2
MQEADIPLLHEWLQRPHVVEWWGRDHIEPSFAQTRAKYLPRVLANEGVRPYIALLGERPIGWAQSYVALGTGDGWWRDETDPGVRGMDQFLCDARMLGQGLGTRMVTAFARLLFSDRTVTRLQTDPSPENVRAIRCYEKSGFRAVKRIITPDGPALLMVQDRPPPAAGETAD